MTSLPLQNCIINFNILILKQNHKKIEAQRSYQINIIYILYTSNKVYSNNFN